MPTALLVIQLAVLTVLLWKVVLLESAAPAAIEQLQQTSNAVLPVTAEKQAITVAFPEQRLREIVREELAAQLEHAATSNTAAIAEPPVEPIDDADYEIRRQMVAQSLEYFIEVGQISGVEMANLQTQIARLRDEDRRVMLGQLGRLLDTGKIDGRL